MKAIKGNDQTVKTFEGRRTIKMKKASGKFTRKAMLGAVTLALAMGLAPAAAFAAEGDADLGYEADPSGIVEQTVEIQGTRVSPPTVPSSGIWYQGKQITVAHENKGYKLSGDYKATKLGTYTFTATLESGYEWSDGTTAPKKFTWKIVNGGLAMHRLYNPWSGEHFYTQSDKEKGDLVSAGWRYEGIGWHASGKGDAVYRLYNKWTGDHHFTLNEDEKNKCVKAGWTDEGIGWRSYSYKGKTYDYGVPVYREYNPFAAAFYHNYTASSSEHGNLTRVGWKDEGVGWYGYPQA